MKIAIVGAGGQIGAMVLRRLARRGFEVFGVTRNTFTAGPIADDGFEIRVGSVTDPSQCRNLLSGSDLTINCALQLGLPRVARERNQQILRNLLLETRSHVVHLSTVAVYGSCLDASFSTFRQPRPDGTYGREKVKLERFAADCARAAGRRLSVLRLGHVYGPGQGWSKQIFSLLDTPTWALPFDGAIASNAVHVYRLADALPSLLDHPESVRTINATDEPQQSWRAVFDLHADVTGMPPIRGMPQEESGRLRASFRAAARAGLLRRATGQTRDWVGGIPRKGFVDKPAVRELMDRAMLTLPKQFEQYVNARYRRFAVAQQVPGAAPSGELPPPWFFSDPVPGPNLGAVDRTDAEDSRELGAWYASWAKPMWRMRGVG